MSAKDERAEFLEFLDELAEKYPDLPALYWDKLEEETVPIVGVEVDARNKEICVVIGAADEEPKPLKGAEFLTQLKEAMQANPGYALVLSKWAIVELDEEDEAGEEGEWSYRMDIPITAVGKIDDPPAIVVQTHPFEEEEGEAADEESADG